MSSSGLGFLSAFRKGGCDMPIKPENKARYPANWGEIRQAAGERARWTCQHPGCKAQQYAVGTWRLLGCRGASAGVWTWFPTCGNGPHDAAGQGLDWPSLQRLTYSEARQFAAEWDDAQGGDGEKPIVIVLTCAHLDHQPENCDPSNLRMFCQRHHLAHDHQHHQANAQATRRARAGTAELFA